MSLNTLTNVMLFPWVSMGSASKFAITRDLAILGLKAAESYYTLSGAEQATVQEYGMLSGIRLMRDPRGSGGLLHVDDTEDLIDMVAWRIWDEEQPWYTPGLGYEVIPLSFLGVGTDWIPGTGFDPTASTLLKFPAYWMFRGAIGGQTEAWWDIQRIAVVDRIVASTFYLTGDGYGPWTNAQWPIDFPAGGYDPTLICYGGLVEFLEDVGQRVLYDSDEAALQCNSFGRAPYKNGMWSQDPPFDYYEKVCCVRDHGICPYYVGGTCIEDTQAYSPANGRWKAYSWQVNKCKSRIWQRNDPNGKWTGCTNGAGISITPTGEWDGVYTVGTGHSWVRIEEAIALMIKQLRYGFISKGAWGTGGSVEVV